LKHIGLHLAVLTQYRHVTDGHTTTALYRASIASRDKNDLPELLVCVGIPASLSNQQYHRPNLRYRTGEQYFCAVSLTLEEGFNFRRFLGVCRCHRCYYC